MHGQDCRTVQGEAEADQPGEASASGKGRKKKKKTSAAERKAAAQAGSSEAAAVPEEAAAAPDAKPAAEWWTGNAGVWRPSLFWRRCWKREL